MVRAGEALARLTAEIDRILGVLARTGAVRVAPDALQPADLLLDLYGEDIRGRAYVTRDDGGERMLRPDFTVPVARFHMETGTGSPVRYVYAGPVWRRQEAGSGRPAEYIQAGIELFDAPDPAAADAEIFALVHDAAVPAGPLDIATGDMGLLIAAIDALPTSAIRKRALRRHIWRPAAFRRLIERFGPRHAALAEARAELIAAARAPCPADAIAARIADAGHPVGLRGAEDIARRIARMAEEAATPPLAPAEARWLESVLAVRGTAAEALDRFHALARDLAGLAPAVERFAARLDALDRAGHPPGGLPFEASFGRTTLEYYDGFVFGLRAADRADLPPIASGGRYDALTAILGDRPVPAVGGIVRPEALLGLGDALGPAPGHALGARP